MWGHMVSNSKGLKPSIFIFLCEMLVLLIAFVGVSLCNDGVMFVARLLEGLKLGETLQPLFDLNMAIIVAFLIALVTNRAFCYKDMALNRIARNSTAFFIVNSLLLVIGFALNVEMATCIFVVVTIGNLVKFWDIAKNLLGVL